MAGADTYHMTTPVGFTDTTKLVESFSIVAFSVKTSKICGRVKVKM